VPQIQHLLTLCVFINFIYLLTYNSVHHPFDYFCKDDQNWSMTRGRIQYVLHLYKYATKIQVKEV